MTCRFVTLVVATGLSVLAPVRADVPTTAPSADAASRTPAQISQDLTQAKREFAAVTKDPQALSDPAKRSAAAVKALPVLARMDALFTEIGNSQPQGAAQVKAAHAQVLEFRAAFGDADATNTLAAAAADPDAAKALRGQLSQFNVQWLQAGREATAQAKVADAVEPLAKAHPANVAITVAMANWAKEAVTPDVADRLLAAATGMSNPAVAQVGMLKEQIAAARKLKSMESKPFVLTGTTVDGKTFSTAAYQGKVVLVDFWATWCGPCKAELPTVQAAYAKYHDQGLEIVGVSNDYAADALVAFTQQQKMPWPELYDADAGGNHEWNPVTLGYGINAIPHMFLIDRKGMLVSADARATYEKMIPDLVQQPG